MRGLVYLTDEALLLVVIDDQTHLYAHKGLNNRFKKKSSLFVTKP